MGSCLSTARDVDISPNNLVANQAKEVSPPKTKTTEPTVANDKATASPSSPSQTSAKCSKARSEPQEVNEGTERTERSIGGSDRQDLTQQPRQVSEEEYKQNTPRLPLAKVRPGYSSGGSSHYSDESEGHNSNHNHLADLKKELANANDLCEKVVKIETDFGRPIDDVYEGVHDGEILGSGVSGVVRRVKHRSTGVEYAVKCLDLGLIRNPTYVQALREEIFIMCQLDHPNIVRLEEVYESENEIYLIQDLCLGGDLFDRLDEQPDFHYSEAKCARLVKQMLSSVRYLHSKNIIHRDLKLENFLFSSNDKDSELKMIDFGLSKHFTNSGEIQHDCVGTPYTVAPEVIRAEYDEKIDIWALGVITYLLLCGETPFGGVDGESLLCVRNNILKGDVKFVPEELWQHVSAEGKVFVKLLLNPEAKLRPTAKQAQLDPWIQTFGKKGVKEVNSALSPKLAQALLAFKEYSDMRKILREVLSFTLLSEQIVELRKEFEKVDTDGDGEISLYELKNVLMESAEDGSLGRLTEHEVEEIFNVLRVRKSEKKIRWHEFIAAGLSQCNFDDRNLKLAFDRLDYQRKGFITFEDMKDLLGTEDGGENADEEILQMWKDGISECACPLGRIYYDDFRMFVKGQTKERESLTPRRRSRKSLEGSPVLGAVPELTTSPQAKTQTFARFEEMSALESLKMPMLDIPNTPSPPLPPMPQGERKVLKEVDIAFPAEIPPPPGHRRNRSHSLSEPPTIKWYDIEEEEEVTDVTSSQTGGRKTCVVLHSPAIGELKQFIKDESKTPLVINKAHYRKHREFRRSVLEASKLFDKKRHTNNLNRESLDGSAFDRPKRASLVMRRGSARGLKKDSLAKLQSQSAGLCLVPASDYERNIAVEEAAKRSGRIRRPRTKTTSDLSGMLR